MFQHTRVSQIWTPVVSRRSLSLEGWRLKAFSLGTYARTYWPPCVGLSVCECVCVCVRIGYCLCVYTSVPVPTHVLCVSCMSSAADLIRADMEIMFAFSSRQPGWSVSKPVLTAAVHQRPPRLLSPLIPYSIVPLHASQLA